jgi:hypothetical protein
MILITKLWDAKFVMKDQAFFPLGHIKIAKIVLKTSSLVTLKLFLQVWVVWMNRVQGKFMIQTWFHFH